LVKLLPDLLSGKPAGRILFFAPEGVLLALLSRLDYTDQVTTTDYKSQDVDFSGEDIQALSFADESYSLLICNHVLEHVPDDQKAIAECARVLQPGGIAVFTIPGNYPAALTVQFRVPDGNGHYRHYGMDVVEKLRCSFSAVKAVNMSENADPSWKIKRDDYAFLCVK
jgi:SAM-dependent methyltransferase